MYLCYQSKKSQGTKSAPPGEDDELLSLYLKKTAPEQMADVIDDSTAVGVKTKVPKKQRQNNYFCRGRRGRIVKTPPLDWKKQPLADNDEDKVSRHIYPTKKLGFV